MGRKGRPRVAGLSSQWPESAILRTQRLCPNEAVSRYRRHSSFCVLGEGIALEGEVAVVVKYWIRTPFPRDLRR